MEQGRRSMSSNSEKNSPNQSETDDSFDREKSMSTSNDSRSRDPSAEADQPLNFLASKITSLIETAESSFKSHYEKLNCMRPAVRL